MMSISAAHPARARTASRDKLVEFRSAT
jgi:hypothetical protein